jgi:putative spermidine/putrescine transport system substrate-binding protein
MVEYEFTKPDKEKKMKRWSITLVFVLIASLVLTACAPAGTQEPTAGAVQTNTEAAPPADAAPTTEAAPPADATPTTEAAPPTTGSVDYVDWGFSGDLQVPFRQHLADPFESKHPNVNVTLLGGITEDAIAQIRAARGASPIDSIMMGEMRYIDAVQEGLLAPMTVNEVPNLANVSPEFQAPCDGYGAAWMVQLIGVAYNTDLATKPESWTDLWNEEYKGKIGIPSPSANNGFLFLVLVAKLFGGDENNLDVAFEKLDELAPFVVAANPGQLAQLLESGEISLAVNWQTQSGPSIARNPTLDFTIPEPGGAGVISCYTILNGSENKELAYEYINDALSTEFQNQISAPPWYFGPTNVNVTIDPGSEKFLPSMEALSDLMLVDWTIANQVRPDITDEFIRRYGQ